ncbi:BREX-1 system adenine-specific DNA-methyltransferase PglX [Agromyces sp. NBRC 114283]|uniref:BREX-1 system adenine-specific DNA-methyltransferase PglX n=1 Tax=Agromyces sp. NBRC 114283 TaxID=2994521 RepID=UPI0024A4456D|nr:BREX-1 system adenine-specific DNA-methyltransferase PglX [Agromyces sp. NBRC 114283]GLU91038.1 hypothetical protein Agsp01_32930 [Agromyces sp. NBRC 114283]
MDTTLLKSFAASSRTELIREVAARITAVLAQGSPERVEQPRAVSELERAISAGGGGDKGKAHVADKVAYTWFNRIIALRFMDANGYTGIGVVSPAADQVGQPEILAAAKRGQLDGDVVKSANAATIRGLLNGTRQPRPGVDAQAEAYSLLLADYCRYWNRAMPFMFEREGDFTELLIPANVLAEDSVLSRAVNVLTENVCQDVEVIGWLYQFYISERKDEVFAGFKKNKKAGADEIPAATQLFTPHWIVRYLVENSVGRLWMLNHPESRLVDQMDYYIAPVDEETDFLKITRPEELTVIDPACGSGHMLTYAFDLLYAIYEEEGYTPSQIPGLILTNNLYGTEIDPRAGALAAFALTMKAAAKRKLFLKNPVAPKICVLEPVSFSADELNYLVTEDGDRHAEEAFWNQFAEADTVGSLIQPDPVLTARLTQYLATLDDQGDILHADALARAERVIEQAGYLTPRYSVVVANPPYMGSGNMGPVLGDILKRKYPRYKQDLYACFVKRGLDWVAQGGVVAAVTGDTWMFIKSFEEFRKEVLQRAAFSSFIHVHDSGNLPSKFGANSAFVLTVGGDPATHVPFIMTSRPGVEAKRQQIEAALSGGALDENWFVGSTAKFLEIPGYPIAFRLADELVGLLAGPIPMSKRLPAVAGISTGSNDRFFRLWHEVSWGRTGGGSMARPWAPHHKGGPERRWYGNVSHVLRYNTAAVAEMERLPGFRHDGNASYFQPHIGWSALTSSRPSFRMIEAGHTFGSGSKAIIGERVELLNALAVLNSKMAAELLSALSPTMNFEVGSIGRLPTMGTESVALENLVEAAISLAKEDWDDNELSMGFRLSPLLGRGASVRGALDNYAAACAEREQRLSEVEARIEVEVSKAFGLNEPMTRLPKMESRLAAREQTLALVSYFVGCAFGRYSLDEPGLILADQGATLEDYLANVPSPRFRPDADNVIPIVDGDWFEDDIVGRFRQFLRAAFGKQHFDENLQFVTESLGVKRLRDYFVKSFYKDHIQRYKKRPIYWLFSSPKGSFNALIYMHRYTPSTVSTVLTYLREYVTKLESALQQAERAGNAKEADRLRKVLVELNEYEHDTLFPKASENVVIDLDDGVKVNYPKFGAALKKIPGLEAASD